MLHFYLSDLMGISSSIKEVSTVIASSELESSSIIRSVKLNNGPLISSIIEKIDNMFDCFKYCLY